MRTCAVGDQAYVLRRGKIVYDGACGELRDAPDKLHQIYLGGASDLYEMRRANPAPTDSFVP